jgi:hypothetical protein
LVPVVTPFNAALTLISQYEDDICTWRKRYKSGAALMGRRLNGCWVAVSCVVRNGRDRARI